MGTMAALVMVMDLRGLTLDIRLMLMKEGKVLMLRSLDSHSMLGRAMPAKIRGLPTGLIIAVHVLCLA